MHEYSLATRILTAALEAAEAAGADDITAVYVSMHPDGHVDPGDLAGAFEIAAAGTLAEGATLKVAMSADSRGEVAVTAIDTSGDG